MNSNFIGSYKDASVAAQNDCFGVLRQPLRRRNRGRRRAAIDDEGALQKTLRRSIQAKFVSNRRNRKSHNKLK